MHAHSFVNVSVEIITSQLTGSETRNNHANNRLVTASNSENTFKKRHLPDENTEMFTGHFYDIYCNIHNRRVVILLRYTSTTCKSRLHSYNRKDFVSGHVVFNRFVQWSCQVPLILGGQHKI